MDHANCKKKQCSKANWEQNMEKCCSLGMTPLTIETKNNSECFNNFINGVLCLIKILHYNLNQLIRR